MFSKILDVVKEEIVKKLTTDTTAGNNEIIAAEAVKNPTLIKEDKKQRYIKHMKDSKKKGDDYEKHVAKHYEEKGYIVKFNGIEKGKKDSSIDLIAIKKEELILIQCKDWKEDGKYKINHEKIKAFVGDTYAFIEKNKNYAEYEISRIFAVSGKILDTSAIKFIKANKEIVRYQLLTK